MKAKKDIIYWKMIENQSIIDYIRFENAFLICWFIYLIISTLKTQSRNVHETKSLKVMQIYTCFLWNANLKLNLNLNLKLNSYLSSFNPFNPNHWIAQNFRSFLTFLDSISIPRLPISRDHYWSLSIIDYILQHHPKTRPELLNLIQGIYYEHKKWIHKSSKTHQLTNSLHRNNTTHNSLTHKLPLLVISIQFFDQSHRSIGKRTEIWTLFL